MTETGGSAEVAPEPPKYKPAFKVDFCSHEAARHAVLRWHYSRAMPSSKMVRIGVWEDERFVGAILYGVGANRHLASPFGLQPTEVCELVRVALAPKVNRYWPTSKCVAKSLKLLKRQSPGLKVVVSYADMSQGHTGVIYHACNFTYLGKTFQTYLKVKGQVVHPRTLYDKYGPGGQSLEWLQKHIDPRAKRVSMPAKHKFAYALARGRITLRNG